MKGKITLTIAAMPGVSAAVSGERVTGNELKAFFEGKTVIGVHLKHGDIRTFWGGDGRVHSIAANGKQRRGKWWIEGSKKRCVRWDHTDRDRCHYLEKNADGTHTLVHGRKGTHLVEISQTLEGNRLGQ